MTEWEEFKASLKTEEELLTEGWALHSVCGHILGVGPLVWQMGKENPNTEYEIVSGDSGFEVKIMSRAKE